MVAEVEVVSIKVEEEVEEEVVAVGAADRAVLEEEEAAAAEAEIALVEEEAAAEETVLVVVVAEIDEVLEEVAAVVTLAEVVEEEEEVVLAEVVKSGKTVKTLCEKFRLSVCILYLHNFSLRYCSWFRFRKYLLPQNVVIKNIFVNLRLFFYPNHCFFLCLKNV